MASPFVMINIQINFTGCILKQILVLAEAADNIAAQPHIGVIAHAHDLPDGAEGGLRAGKTAASNSSAAASSNKSGRTARNPILPIIAPPVQKLFHAAPASPGALVKHISLQSKRQYFCLHCSGHSARCTMLAQFSQNFEKILAPEKFTQIF
jgi:hypothetical protein